MLFFILCLRNSLVKLLMKGATVGEAGPHLYK